MAQRRSLVEGLDVGDVDPALVEEFVYNRAPGPAKEPQGKEAAAPPVQAKEGKGPVGRVGLTTRIRSDFAAALKRATLERKLAGVTPNAVQEILEQALEPWLKTNGYLN
jgi:hypothetical protein